MDWEGERFVRQTDRKSGTPKKTKKMRERQRDENCCKHRERLGRVAHRETHTHTHTHIHRGSESWVQCSSAAH